MAVTTERATELTNYVSGDFSDLYGVTKLVKKFSFTQGAAAGDTASTAEIVVLPAGDVTILLTECWIGHSAIGSSSTMAMGWLAYTKPDGTAAVADPNGLDDGQGVVSAGGFSPTGTIDEEMYNFKSRSGVSLTLQVNGAALPAAATLTGWISYIKAG
jgi:hypothetical protein